jgi:hypothetical protein
VEPHLQRLINKKKVEKTTFTIFYFKNQIGTAAGAETN